jgi:glutathione synthase/RimK-type ligase-like ATP-grasp enzyme
MDGNYLTKRDVLKEYPLIIKEYAGVNRTEKIDGKLKIKKNVYKLDDPGSFNQEHLKDQNLSNFFIQEFSPTAKDMRIFVQNGKVVAGWIRQAKDGFMTVSHGEYSMYNKPDREIKKIAEKVAKKLKANFIAVDLMFIDDKPYLQEISLHPGFKAYENKTPGKPINIAKTIIESF